MSVESAFGFGYVFLQSFGYEIAVDIFGVNARFVDFGLQGVEVLLC